VIDSAIAFHAIKIYKQGVQIDIDFINGLPLKFNGRAKSILEYGPHFSVDYRNVSLNNQQGFQLAKILTLNFSKVNFCRG
jgi:hypothetical protein